VTGAEMLAAVTGRLTGIGGPAGTLSYGTERRSCPDIEDIRGRDFFLPKRVSIMWLSLVSSLGRDGR
jgi:hypothetical protein